MDSVSRWALEMISDSDNTSVENNNVNQISIAAYDEKEHPWFAKLDWNADERYKNFGRDKTMNH